MIIETKQYKFKEIEHLLNNCFICGKKIKNPSKLGKKGYWGNANGTGGYVDLECKSCDALIEFSFLFEDNLENIIDAYILESIWIGVVEIRNNSGNLELNARSGYTLPLEGNRIDINNIQKLLLLI